MPNLRGRNPTRSTLADYHKLARMPGAERVDFRDERGTLRGGWRWGEYLFAPVVDRGMRSIIRWEVVG